MTNADEANVGALCSDRRRGLEKHFVILDRVESRDVADNLYVVAHVPLRANAVAFHVIWIERIRVVPVWNEYHFLVRQSAFDRIFKTGHGIDSDARSEARKPRLQPNGEFFGPIEVF